MDKEKLQEILKKHSKWLNDEEGGERADLRGANLRGADLFRSVLPLWCGGLKWKLNRLRMGQLAYHFCSMDCEDEDVKALQKSLYKLANEFAESRNDLRNKKYQE